MGIIIRIIRKKNNADTSSRAWKVRRLTTLAVLLLSGVLLNRMILMPMEGASVIKTAYAWKCIMLGFLSLITVGNACLVLKTSGNYVGTKNQKRRYSVTAVMGMILFVNVWCWELYNFWSR